MLYPRTSRLVRTNAYFIPAFSGMGYLGQDLPITSKIAQQDEMFRRDQRKVQEIQKRIDLLNRVVPAGKKGWSIPPELASEFPRPKPVSGFNNRSAFGQNIKARAAYMRMVPEKKKLMLDKATAEMEAAQDDLQHAANSALNRLLIQLPYKAHIIVGRYVPSKDAVVYDVTKDGAMVQEGVSDVAGAKGVVDKQIAAQQEAAMAAAEQERIVAQRAAEQQGPASALVEDVAMDLTAPPEQRVGPGGIPPGPRAPTTNGGAQKKSNLPLILGAGAAGIAALVLMK